MDSNKTSQFVKLIESTIPELENQSEDYKSNYYLNAYHSILISYYKMELNNLESLIETLTSRSKKTEKELSEQHVQSELAIIIHLAKLRLAIRKNKISKFLITNLAEALEHSTYDIQKLWSGEVYILIAFALGELNEFKESLKYYELAITFLELINAKKKTLRARQNLIATQESLFIHKNILYNYNILYHEAFALKAYGTVGLALMNLARGFQKLKLYPLALRYINRALAVIRKDPFTIQYYLVHLYRAHIFIDLNRIDEAQKMILVCRSSSLSEIQGGIILLEKIIAKNPPSSLSLKKGQRLLFGWFDRLKFAFSTKSLANKSLFSKLEEELLILICLNKPTLEEAAVKIYGDSIEIEFTIDRVKDLIKRINKKISPKIIRENNILLLSDTFN